MNALSTIRHVISFSDLSEKAKTQLEAAAQEVIEQDRRIMRLEGRLTRLQILIAAVTVESGKPL